MFNTLSFSGVRHAITHSPPIRLAIQTAVAGAAAFAVGSAFGLEKLSWAVITSLFVVQATMGARCKWR